MDRWLQLARVIIALVAALALVALVGNFIITGRDVPSGLLSLLGGTIGLVFGIEVIQKRKEGGDK